MVQAATPGVVETGIRVQVETPAPPVPIRRMGHLERKRLPVDSVSGCRVSPP